MNSLGRKIVVAILILMLPISLNFIYVLTLGTHLHYLMVFSYQLCYLWALYPMLLGVLPGGEIWKQRLCLGIAVVLSIIVIRFSNDIFYYQKLVGDGTTATMTNVLYDIERNENYVEGTKIVLLGNPREAFAQDYIMQDVFEKYVGVDDGNGITYNMVLADT